MKFPPSQPRHPSGTILTPILAAACLHENPWLELTPHKSVVENSTVDTDMMLAMSGGLVTVLHTVRVLFDVQLTPCSSWQTILVNTHETETVYRNLYHPKNPHYHSDAFATVRTWLASRIPYHQLSRVPPTPLQTEHLSPSPYHYSILNPKTIHYVGWHSHDPVNPVVLLNIE